ncbi:conserved hypothetical protein [Perkinsus marinus ATCC 50983]|uniref:Polycystin cation channel PKD1/PKD2 domain-containing protein n=1 Tax=Perkinsus marinus (strain ATCC 50983 / TXsc) TaxID=423536 RepID=C5K4E0_PERM5|nr:conserved hypothetical protein [Perkinsus marinus ATCC 50983]EER20633.1 conserved hypothetical protein [Perkinsus marinus ATCC 50983]|eukprot:XP_002788837.1 conserved hypothetical protein [Perkinsus marinus ATCC 50983]
MQKEPYGVKLIDDTGQSITIDDVIKLGRGNLAHRNVREPNEAGEEVVQSATTEVPTDEEIQRNAIDARYIWFEYDDATTDSNGVSTSLPNHKGKFATYPPGGYMVQLPTDPDDYDRRTELLQIANFVDLSTRAVFLEMGVWNNNLGLFGVVLVTIEFSPSGLVSPEVHVTTLQPRVFLTPEGIGSIGEWMTTFGEVIVVMFMLYYVAEAATELAKARWKYFNDSCNTHHVHHRIRNDIVSIFLKLFKFIAPLPHIKLLLKSLRGGCRQWGAFIVLFVTTFVAFVTAFNVAFGASINELSTFGKTFLFLSRGFLRDADLNLIYAERPVVGTVAVLFYVVVVYFLLANQMFAIILAGLSDEVSNGRGIEEGENDV